jgi:two-component system chemotaxis response regulator CheY
VNWRHWLVRQAVIMSAVGSQAIPAAVPEPVGLRFLVVDDVAAMRRIVTKFLHDLGYPDVTEAGDGRTALKILQQGNIDILVTDLYMPGMQGIELLKAARADPSLVNLRVLMITGNEGRQQIVEAIHAGVNGYMVKPFTAGALKERIDHVLASWAAS